MAQNEIEKWKKTILMEIPQVPLVIQHIEQAMKIAEANKSEDELINSLRLAHDVIPYAKQNGGDNFFKYYLLTVCLLGGLKGIEETKEFKNLDTADELIKHCVKLFNDSHTDKFRDYAIMLKKVMETDVDIFCILLQEISNKLKFDKDANILGYAYTLMSLKVINLEVPPVAVPTYNEFQISVSNSDF